MTTLLYLIVYSNEYFNLLLQQLRILVWSSQKNTP